MKIKFAFLIVVNLISSLFCSKNFCQSPTTLEAFEFYTEKKYYEAIVKFSETINNGPDNEKHYCMYYRAYANLVLGNNEKSLEDLFNSLQIDVSNEYYTWTMASSNFLIARIFERQGDLQQAIKYLYSAMEFSPDSYGIYSDLSLIQIKNNQLDSAYINITKAIDLDSTKATSFSNLSLILLKMGQIEDALTAVNHSLKLDSTNPYAYKHKALAYLKIGDIEKACTCLEKANSNGYKYYNETHPIDANEVDELISSNCKIETNKN